MWKIKQYLYQLLLIQTDVDHTLTTRQIMQKMKEEEGIKWSIFMI